MQQVVGTWRGIGASVTGSSHLKLGRGCEDAHAYRQIGGDIFVAAVADGAGSALRAAEGASLAVQTAVESIQAFLSIKGTGDWREILITSLGQVRTGLENLAAQEKYNLRDLATTLLIAVVTPAEVAVLQLGDGAIVVQEANGNFQTLTEPDHTEYVNETIFVTSDDYLGRAQVSVRAVSNVEGVALLSDGLQMLALDLSNNTPFAPFFNPLFRFASSRNSPEAELNHKLAAFLDSERVADITDDDKTLVLAVRA